MAFCLAKPYLRAKWRQTIKVTSKNSVNGCFVPWHDLSLIGSLFSLKSSLSVSILYPFQRFYMWFRFLFSKTSCSILTSVFHLFLKKMKKRRKIIWGALTITFILIAFQGKSLVEVNQ